MIYSIYSILVGSFCYKFGDLGTFIIGHFCLTWDRYFMSVGMELWGWFFCHCRRFLNILFFGWVPREKICYFWKNKLLQTRWSAYCVRWACYNNGFGCMVDGLGRRFIFSKVKISFSEGGWRMRVCEKNFSWVI